MDGRRPRATTGTGLQTTRPDRAKDVSKLASPRRIPAGTADHTRRLTTGQDIERRAAVAHLIEHADDLPPETLAAHIAVELALPVTDGLTEPIEALREWTTWADAIADSGEGPARRLLGDDWAGTAADDALDLCGNQIEDAWVQLRQLPTGPAVGDQVLYTGVCGGERWDGCRQQPSVVTAVDTAGEWVHASRPGMHWSAPAAEVRLVGRAVYVPVDQTGGAR
jgi:hypothetical protein